MQSGKGKTRARTGQPLRVQIAHVDHRIILEGEDVSPALVKRLVAWLKAQG
jgi:hypothetical protein